MGERWLKAELHSHCDWDPYDCRICDSSPDALIREAARHGYDVLAVTCHDLDIWCPELAEYAESFGITLIPGMEVLVEGRRHALVYNFRTSPQDLDTLDKIRTLRRADTLVVAPHPFFPAGSCLGRLLEKNLDVFDAIEFSGFYTRHLDFNRKALRIARENQKPMVGNADVHFQWQLGKTFTWIYSEPGIQPILNAIKSSRVKVKTSPLSMREASRWWIEASRRHLLSPKSPSSRQVGRFAPHGT
jgi:predicted metal-dependent phosphoesterase TrpH